MIKLLNLYSIKMFFEIMSEIQQASTNVIEVFLTNVSWVLEFHKTFLI